MKALESGIPLKGDIVYEDLIEQYPHYKAKAERRLKQVKAMRKFIQRVDSKSQSDDGEVVLYKYKFEEFAASGRRNLSQSRRTR